jgi:hypothetical protein
MGTAIRIMQNFFSCEISVDFGDSLKGIKKKGKMKSKLWKEKFRKKQE